jgi:translin
MDMQVYPNRTTNLEHLAQIIESINQDFESKSTVRDETLKQSRLLIRHCANTIRAVHRHEIDVADALLQEAKEIATEMVNNAKQFPDVYYAGYTQDAMKEFAEAHLTYALVLNKPLPSPQDLGVENPAYINGLAEATGELRRYALDALRQGEVSTSESLLNTMQEIYTALITIDFPSAITGGLRRNTDMVRGVLERTRGDVTTAVRQESMKTALASFEAQVKTLQVNA